MNFQDFSQDVKTQFAVIRCFEIAGEATKRLPVDFTGAQTDIPWKLMAGMRDRLIHGYDQVDVALLWRTLQTDIPELKAKLDRLSP
jgi:uncharacterized protein with HEPN domain